MEVIKLDDFPINPIQDQIYEIIPDKTKIVASTNRLFNKYPTRYISAVPRFAINAYSKAGETVLDPFCGSGTTAIEAMLLGRNAMSIDIDPFARLLIKVKTTVYSKEDIDFLDEVVRKIKEMSPDESFQYPIPGIPNIEKWFCDKSILWLSFFKYTIDKLAADNQNVKDYLYVVLSGIIRKVSNADEVSPKPYISTKYPKTPADPSELFFKVENMYREAIIGFSEAVAPLHCNSTILESNNARTINAENTIDLAVTSPPYINAYDYVRSLRFEDKYRYASQSETVVPIVEKITEVDAKRAAIVNTYFEDMAKNMIAVREELKQNGRYVIVVGDSNIRGQSIPTAKVLAEIAEKNGYIFELSFKYVIRDRYLHLPRGNRGGIIKYDEILVLKKK